MTTFPEHTLPLATTSPFTQYAHPPRQAPGEWSKALEQAQRAGTGAPAREPEAHWVTSGSQGVPGKSPGVRWQLASHPDAIAPPGDPASFEYWLAPRGAASMVATGVTCQADAPDPTDSRTQQAAPARKPAAPSAPERSALHVHVEQHADGAAVWLGVHAGLAAQTVASLCAAVRQMLPPGTALARLTCNGRSLYDHLATTPEIP
jgi:hypothetical protein